MIRATTTTILEPGRVDSAARFAFGENSVPYFHLTRRSDNEKTGPIPVSTTGAETCPDACGFKRTADGVRGCYADGGPLGMHWREVTEGGDRALTWSAFLERVREIPAGQIWRHNQAGDLPGVGNWIATARLAELCDANGDANGFTYTHKPVTGDGARERANREAIERSADGSFTINLSADGLRQADTLADLGIAPVVVVLPADLDGATTPTVKTPEGRTVTVCPATYRDDTTCATCGLCAMRQRRAIVGFPAHGSSKRRASAVAESN